MIAIILKFVIADTIRQCKDVITTILVSWENAKIV